MILRRFVQSKFQLKCLTKRIGCKQLVEKDVQHMLCDILVQGLGSDYFYICFGVNSSEDAKNFFWEKFVILKQVGKYFIKS